MGTKSYDISVRSSASPAVVFAVVADGPGWTRWTSLGHATYEAEGTPAPHGVGAIRLFGAGFGPKSREQVVEYEPDHHFAYISLTGPLPMKDYRADVRLSAESSGGTVISWKGSFQSAMPGMGWFISRMVNGFAKGLVVESERVAGTIQSD
jgi:hypothetical protein